MNGGQAAAMAVAGVVFNWQILPRIGGKALWRGADHAKGYPLGILLYPLSVLGLTLWFWSSLWMAAAIWGVLAVGDGMASVVGQAAGGPRLPWNDRKSWPGFVAFVGFGTLAAAVLIAWTARLPLDLASWHAGRTVGLAFAVSLACALVESLPTTLDDNLTVPLAGAVVFPLFAQADPQMLATDPGLGGRVAAGLLVNAAIALVAWRARSLDLAGALSAVGIGTAITAGLGLPSLGPMIAFFVVGTASTTVRHRIKAGRGTAAGRAGVRGWRHAWANGGVPAFIALLAGLNAGSLPDLPGLALAGAVGTAAPGTCSSEVGKAYGRRTFLITSLRPVPPGTEGAISLEGTLAGLAGAMVIASVGVAGGLYGPSAAALVAIAGLLGSLAESVLGTVAEKRGWLDNDLLNAVNTAIGAALVVLMVRAAA